MSDKIHPNHLARKAILYVRQSSAYQVNHNLESQRLQYAMRERLVQLGWHEIEIVDEDLGRSAAGLVTRSGFERMVADVCLGKVGAVAAREVSRFARNSRERAKPQDGRPQGILHQHQDDLDKAKHFRRLPHSRRSCHSAQLGWWMRIASRSVLRSWV